MLNFEINGKNTTCHASGTHKAMLTEAIVLETELHRFVYRLGHAEYLAFLMELAKITQSDDFIDFLEGTPDEETRISMPNLNREGEKDGE